MKLRDLPPNSKYRVPGIDYLTFVKLDLLHSYGAYSNQDLQPSKDIIHSDPDLDVIPLHPEPHEHLDKEDCIICYNHKLNYHGKK